MECVFASRTNLNVRASSPFFTFQSNYKLLSQIALLWIHCSLDEEKLQCYVGESKLERVALVFGGRPKSEGENWEEMPKFVSD